MDNFKNYKVLRFFEEISHIPRNSFKEEKIKEYLINFAKVRGLKFYEDKFNNVIIYKKTCSKEPIILQAHTDMVCVKKAFSNFNFDTDGIVLQKKEIFYLLKKPLLAQMME